MKLTFLGGAGTVTGSKTLVETARARVLVDCGLFQGFKHLRLKNRAALEVEPASIKSVILTHAHLDHSGWLPVLAKVGFVGKVFCSEATRALVEILLLDAAHLEVEQAAWLAKKKKSKHDPPLPLFTTDDAERAIALLSPVGFEVPFSPADGVDASLTPAGHILGAACVRVAADGGSVLFSGDVGRPNDALMKPPKVPPASDVLVLESTYGARRHAESDPKAALAAVAKRTIERGGVLMIPAFAVGRAQVLLHLFRELMNEGIVPQVPVYLNSPMATDVTEVTCTHHHEHRLNDEQCHAMCKLPHIVHTTEESKQLNTKKGPMIVIAGSGMMTGGRFLHHLFAWGGDKKNTVLLVGYQAPGTRGSTLLSGSATLRLFGEDVPMRAEIARIDALSGHADADELIAWLKQFPWRPRQVLLNHGEPEGGDALRQRIEHELDWPARVVTERESVAVDRSA